MINYFKVERVEYNIMPNGMSKRKRDKGSIKCKRVMSPIMGHNQIRIYANQITVSSGFGITEPNK
ncbi:hypothetical protein Hdeb2414_s0010g00336291 [Helianthus debilis subsp. tardiflorus]